MTPFGRPVLPEEKITVAKSSAQNPLAPANKMIPYFKGLFFCGNFLDYFLDY